MRKFRRDTTIEYDGYAWYLSEGYYRNDTLGKLHRYIWEKANGKIPEGHHIHHKDHNKINNVHHLTLGGGGAPLYDPSGTSEGLILSEKSFHFAKINIDNDIMRVDIIRPDGSFIETFEVFLYLSVPKGLRER